MDSVAINVVVCIAVVLKSVVSAGIDVFSLIKGVLCIGVA